uniref:ATP-binding protein n=1 Tax=Candidatus Electronema sp. TaxID=2698783 RepID=UPI004055FC54
MKTLLWKLCSSYFLLAALILTLCLAAASLLLQQSVISQAQDELAAQARLLRVRLERQDAAAYGGICAEFSAALGSRFTVISAAGQVLADSEQDLHFDNHADRPEILAALAGAVGVSRRRSHSLGKELLYVAVPLRRGDEIWGAARAALPAYLLDERLAYLRGTLLLAAVPALLLAAAASFLLALRVSKPLQEIEQGVLRFTQGSLRHRIRITGPLEITNLAESCNRMAAQLDEQSESLRKQLALLESTFRSMAEAVIVLDPEGRILRCNQAAGRLFSFDPSAAEQRDIQEVIRLADVQQFFEKTIQQGGGATEDIITISAGREKILSANGARLRSESGANAGALLVFHDITRLKRLETMRRDFAANVSHELKTPITAISGFVETLRDGALHEPDAERFLDIIARNVQRLRTIIEDLLALARLEQEEESGQISLSWKAVRPVLENAAAICAKAAAEKNISLELDCPDTLRARLNAPLLEQAVVNLLDNAVKYSSSQKSRVILRAAQEQGGVLIVVQDFGCGIPREHHARLFERFYRVDKARSCKLGGTGLGLAIVKHIVQAHHGAVSVESAPGRGSVFTVRLPG